MEIIMSKVMSLYSDMQNIIAKEEPFNEKLLHLKETDDFKKYVDIAAKSLDAVDGIDYLGSVQGTEEDVIASRKNKHIDESRLIMITMKFRVSGYDDKNKVDKVEIIDVPIFFFKLLKGNYFLYNGVKYVPIFQLTDKVYVLRNKIVLKTLTMGIFVGNTVKTVVSDSGKDVTGNIYAAHLFSKEVNMFHYYLAKMGMNGTLNYFGFKNNDMLILNKKHSENYENVIKNRDVFVIKKGSVLAIRKGILKTQFKKDIFISILALLRKMSFRFQEFDTEYFTKKLGGFFGNISNGLKKGTKVLVSFDNLLDDYTKTILDLPEDVTKDTYSVVKWMMTNYRELQKHSNLDIGKKRLRFYEYMIVPLVVSFNKSSHRIFNSRGAVTFSVLSSMFNKLLKTRGVLLKSAMDNELIRYDNVTYNFLDMFTRLKISQKGPQSIASKGGGRNDVSVMYRSLDPSYISRVSLVHASAGDPGMNLMLTPFTELDDNAYFMERSPEIEKEVAKLSFTKMDHIEFDIDNVDKMFDGDVAKLEDVE